MGDSEKAETLKTETLRSEDRGQVLTSGTQKRQDAGNAEF
jgi:hypothetical protein